jgi:hypothetical protein
MNDFCLNKLPVQVTTTKAIARLEAVSKRTTIEAKERIEKNRNDARRNHLKGIKRMIRRGIRANLK